MGLDELVYEELHALYLSRNIIRVIKSRQMRRVGNVVLMGEMGAYRVLVRRPDGKKPLGRPKRRRNVDIITDLK